MRSTKRSRILSLPVLCLGLGLTQTAKADLQLVSPNPFTDLGGQGLGAVVTVLTLQSPSNTTVETGCIGVATGGAQTTSQSTCGFADSTVQQQSFVRDITQYDAYDLRIIFNAQEPGNDGIIMLTDLVATIYSPNGTKLFTSTGVLDTEGNPINQANPYTFQAESGVGNSGYVFQFTAAQADAINALNGTLYLGLGARLIDANSSNDTFNLGVMGGTVPPSAIPEPSTWMMLGGGLLAVAGFGRRKKA